MSSTDPELWVTHLGVVPYADALELQEELRARRQAGLIPDTLLLLEHPPVYTRGRRSEAGDLPMGEDWYRAQGIEVTATTRGGRVTYHGPGQLVGYPIMAIGDVLAFLRTMESRADRGVRGRGRRRAGVREGLTGVWVGERKIGSIGVHVSRGVTMHGFAVNVENDLQPFEWIVPCGIDGVRMTSLLRELSRVGGMGCFRKRVAWRFASAFERRQRIVTLERLRQADGRRALAGVGA